MRVVQARGARDRPQVSGDLDRAASTVAGVAALVEVIELDPEICLYCNGVHVLTLLLLGIGLAAPAFAEDQSGHQTAA